MNKSDLIDSMATDAGISKATAKKALDSFLGNVKTALKDGERVSLVGFGTWSVSERAAREGRNPQTGRSEERRVGKECRGRWSPSDRTRKRRIVETKMSRLETSG